MQSHYYLSSLPPNILLKKMHLLTTPHNFDSYPPPFFQFLVNVDQDIHANIGTPHKMQPTRNKEIEKATLHIRAHYLHTNKTMWKNNHNIKHLSPSHHQLPRMCCFMFLAIDDTITFTLGFHPICLHHKGIYKWCILVLCEYLG